MPTLSIGTCSDDPRKINKTFSGSASPTVNIKDGCSIENPIFILDYNSSYAGYNYCYYADFKRYYYINDIIMQPGGRAELHCAVDPLMSFKTAINALTCYVSRIGDASQRAAFMSDPSFPISNEAYTKILHFNGGVNFTANAESQKQYILTVIGGPGLD